MASKKISYNQAKNTTNTTNQLAEIFNNSTNSTPIKTIFQKINPKDIHTDPKEEFTKLFPLVEVDVEKIKENMIAKGYDHSQPIHLATILEEPETKENPIEIDGQHRRNAAIRAGIEEVDVYIHTFETRREALIYALELQIIRRNLTDGQKASAVQRLDSLKNPGRKKEEDESSKGKSAVETGKMLGMSPRQVEKVRNVLNNGDEETISDMLSDNISINKAEKKVQKTKKKDNEDTPDEGLSSNEGTPAGLNFNHSDGHERPHRDPWEEDSENEADKLVIARRESRSEGKEEGYEEGLTKGSEIAFAVFEFAIAEISKGRSPKDVFNDDRVSDFSPSVIKDFLLPEDDEEIINTL